MTSAACTCDSAQLPNVTDARCPQHGVLSFLASGAVDQPDEVEPTSGEAQGWERVEELRDKAARRGRIDHAEGARYVMADWDDVLFLIAEIDELRAALNYKEDIGADS